MSQFNRNNLKSLEKLAKITCTKEEEERLFQSIKKILDYVKQLEQIDTKDVNCCDYVSQIQNSNVFREDEIKNPLSTQTLLENAPDHIGDMIRTPPVIEQ